MVYRCKAKRLPWMVAGASCYWHKASGSMVQARIVAVRGEVLVVTQLFGIAAGVEREAAVRRVFPFNRHPEKAHANAGRKPKAV